MFVCRSRYLKHTIEALGPRLGGPLTIEDCVGSASDPEAAAALFFKHGFVVIRNCFTPEAAAAMVAGWERAEATARPAWVIIHPNKQSRRPSGFRK